MKAFGKLAAAVTALPLALAACGEEMPEGTLPKDPAVTVTATVETAAMPDADDAADDPAIWINPSDPAHSVIIGTNKRRGLGIYALDGTELAFRADGRMNNVDIRQNVTLGAITADVVAATNRSDKTIAVYALDPADKTLSPLLPPIETEFGDPYGLCLYRHSSTGDLYIFATEADTGQVGQWRLSASEGTGIAAERVRTIRLDSQAEGCAADDEQGLLFIAEEDVGLYAYWADPNVPENRRNARYVIDKVDGGHLTADAEGVAIIREGRDGAGYVIVSSQGSNSYNVYDRRAPYAFRGSFVIGDGETIDGVEETDGIDGTAANLGPAFPDGVFVAQDGFNYGGPNGERANQNFKLMPWADIRAALSLPEPDASEENAPGTDGAGVESESEN